MLSQKIMTLWCVSSTKIILQHQKDTCLEMIMVRLNRIKYKSMPARLVSGLRGHHATSRAVSLKRTPLRQELCLRGYGALDAWGLLLEYFLSTGSNGGHPLFAASHDLRAEDVGFDALQTVAGGPR